MFANSSRTNRTSALFFILLLSVGLVEAADSEYDASSSVDNLYETALRYEVLGMREEAWKALNIAMELEPSRTSLSISLERLSSLSQCQKGSPFFSNLESKADGALEGGMSVESVAFGMCGVLLSAQHAAPVGQQFTRQNPLESHLVFNTEEDIDEVVLDGCEKSSGLRASKVWHTLKIRMPEKEEVSLLSWVEGDDPFVIARLFLRYNELQDQSQLRPIYALIVQRHAALKNASINAHAPPWDIPEEHMQSFTMNGRVEVTKHYVDESTKHSRTNYEFGFYRKSRDEIEALVSHAQRRGTNYYGDTDTFLFAALDSLPGGLKDKHVVIMGSLEPWYEAVCIAYEAASCTTIEYNKLSFDHPKIQTYTVDEYDDLSPRPQYDVALSISSFEHDGLGRYGDAIDPEGDIKAMRNMKRILKPQGVLLLAVPVGKDLVKWNAHRKYGRLRLPLLFAEWTLVGQSGLTRQILDNEYADTHIQPVWILQNAAPSKPGIDWDSLLSPQA